MQMQMPQTKHDNSQAQFICSLNQSLDVEKTLKKTLFLEDIEETTLRLLISWENVGYSES